MSLSPLIILCTCPDLATAERIAETVVGERLAACVNIVPGLTSIYR
jgi:periplasmic divalent cation tolerance protein